MKRKEPWMRKGASVLALGKPAKITSMQENRLAGIDYVYYIMAKLEGEKTAGTYHPNDITANGLENIPQKHQNLFLNGEA